VSDANSSSERRLAFSCSHERKTWSFTHSTSGGVNLGDRPPCRQESPDSPQLHQRGDRTWGAQTGRFGAQRVGGG
jgi:hypothetical protein